MTTTGAPGESAALHEYRLAARAWIAGHLTRFEGDDPDLVAERTPDSVAAARRIQATLYAAGYAGFTFPVEHGGQGLTPDHERVFLEEAKGFHVPTRQFGVSINVLGAALAAFGTPEQQAAHLPRVLAGEELWLQLLSEPGGGSDLAGLLTSARRDGDHYVVNGQKTWSSGAQFADFALCPVRTRWDVPKHRGISVLIVDLRAPGIEIRPIRQINGEAYFCEEFFTDVGVPVANLVGEEHDGWRVIRGLLAIEHAWVGRGAPKRADTLHDVDDLVAMAARRGLAADPLVRRELAGLYVAMRVQQMLSARVPQAIAAGRMSPGYGGVLKLGRDALLQRAASVGFGLAGAAGTAWEPDDAGGSGWATTVLSSRGASISGGTDEIQRNNVGEKVLGLPREPSADRDVPFDQVPHN
jgi:alkylation response protein AidB-like acyl-CoA dehydrogenase